MAVTNSNDRQAPAMAELRAAAKKLGIKTGGCSKAALVSMINERISAKSAIDGISAAIDSVGANTSQENDGQSDDGLTDSTEIAVRSITAGTLIYKQEKGRAVIWNGIGAVKTLTLAQITEMNDRSERFLRAPLLILLDDRAVRRFALTQLYERISRISDLSALFSSDTSVISEELDIALDANMRDILISKTRKMYKDKALTNIDLIRMLEKKLSFELADDGG